LSHPFHLLQVFVTLLTWPSTAFTQHSLLVVLEGTKPPSSPCLTSNSPSRSTSLPRSTSNTCGRSLSSLTLYRLPSAISALWPDSHANVWRTRLPTPSLLPSKRRPASFLPSLPLTTFTARTLANVAWLFPFTFTFSSSHRLLTKAAMGTYDSTIG